MAFGPIIITVCTDPSHPPFERRREPVSVGVPCPRGIVQRAEHWGLTDQSGGAVPVQLTPLDRWPDSSVRWLLAEFDADAPPDAPSYYALGPDGANQPAEPSIAIEHAGEVVRVFTGVATIDVPRSGAAFLVAARVGEASLVRSATITAEDDGGLRHEFIIRRATIARRGALRAAIHLDGNFVRPNGQNWLDATVRLKFFAVLGTMFVDFDVTNPQAARHSDGAWDLGDPGSVLIRDLSIEIALDGGDQMGVRGSSDPNDPMAPSAQRFAVYQDSSGGANWQHINHVNRDNHSTATFRGFRAMRGDRVIEGLRAMPIASVGDGPSRVTVAVPRFWQTFPKSIEAGPGCCRIGMFPRNHGDLHELQGGERSTITFALCFGRDTVSAEPLAWVRAPLGVSADPLSYRHAGGWAPLAAGSPSSMEGYETLVNRAISGDSPFEQRREQIDEFGWRNFGELYADHEAIDGGGQVNTSLASHYNNQYDAIAGFITRFMHTADQQWWKLADDLARHVSDIDIYHTSRDRAAYNGGYFWHTQHYQPARTATHRSYSRRGGSSGGGPSCEHNYTTGLMLHHFLTGSEKSRAAVIELANWVLDMDDGRKSRFRWIDRRDTGLASVTRSPDFVGPGRGAANSINALLDAHRLTHDTRYLEKAEILVARCVHPGDDVEGFDLLDVENQWSYTVFFQVLGKYLDYRAERGLTDTAFEYARATLLKYAVWMSEYERPYLETPEKLEFPTETWAAQDLRKAAVFEFAARYSGDPEQASVFVGRAHGFVDASIASLLKSPTGQLTRPIVLLLAYAFQRPQREAPAIAASQPVVWLPRVKFVPQRRRVMRRLVWAGAGASAAALLVIALLAS